MILCGLIDVLIVTLFFVYLAPLPACIKRPEIRKIRKADLDNQFRFKSRFDPSGGNNPK